MRFRLLMLLMLLGVATATTAQINIGINFSLFPELVRVPNYPVYYAPRQNANYFFYDGMYWVYQNDDWYSSDWYNGPWWRTAPEYVPEYVLRVPVRYYRRPPAYFHGWGRDAPPRWGEHWGRDWEQRRSGWDRWDRRAAPAPAPLPTYQRQYSGKKYPKVEQQHALQNQKYRYQPKDALVREHVQQRTQAAPAPSARERQREPQRKDSGKDAREREPQRKDSGKDARERDQRPQPQAAPPREQQTPKPAVQPQRPQPQAVTPPREQPAPKSQGKDSGSQGKGASRDPGGDSNRGRDKEQDKGRDKGDDRGRESSK